MVGGLRCSPIAEHWNGVTLRARRYMSPSNSLDRTFNEVGAAIHQTFMQFRSRFIVERGLDEASDQGQAWADAVTGARQLTAFVNDVIAVSIRGRFATD